MLQYMHIRILRSISLSSLQDKKSQISRNRGFISYKDFLGSRSICSLSKNDRFYSVNIQKSIWLRVDRKTELFNYLWNLLRSMLFLVTCIQANFLSHQFLPYPKLLQKNSHSKGQVGYYYIRCSWNYRYYCSDYSSTTFW